MKKYILFTLHYCFFISSLLFLDNNTTILMMNLLFSILILENIHFIILPLILCFYLPLPYTYIILGVLLIHLITYSFIKKNRLYPLFTFSINTILINILLNMMNKYNNQTLYLSLFLFIIYAIINMLHIFYKSDNKHYIITKNNNLVIATLLLAYLFIFYFNNVNHYLYYFLFMQTFLLKDLKYNLIFTFIFSIFLFKTNNYQLLFESISVSFLPISVVLLLDYSNYSYILLIIYSFIVNIINLKEKTITIENDYINSLFNDFSKYINSLNNEFNKNDFIREIKENKLTEYSSSYCAYCNKNTLCKQKLDKRYSFLSAAIMGLKQNIYDCPYYNDFKVNLNYDNINKSFEYSAIKLLAFELSTLYNQSLINKLDYEKFINLLKINNCYLYDLNINFSSPSTYFSFKIRSIKPPIESIIIKAAYKSFGETLELKIINDIYHLFKKPTLKINYAHAVLAKEGNLISGDNYYIKKDYNSNYIFALSDGMGSGYNAYLESVDTLRIITTLSSYHFRIKTILKLLEDIYELRANYDHYATLDLLTIDTANKNVNLYKMGSTTTYVLHNNSLTAYQNKALPHKLDEMNSSFNFDITSGDLIFLLSDGITDFINQNEFYSLININDSPENICSNIINHIKAKEKNNLKDDLSLIVIKSI